MYEKIKGEIERRFKEYSRNEDIYYSVDDQKNASICRHERILCEQLLSFIESLEKKDSVYFTDGEVSLDDASSEKEQSPKIKGWVARDKD